MKAKLNEFTFPDSGKVVFLPQVSVGALALKLQRKYPRPSPPTQVIDYGGVKRTEFNYLHPDYKTAVAEWNAYLESMATEVGLRRLFDITLNKDQIAEVKAWKKANPSAWDESDDDRSLWFEEIAISSDADLKALMTYLTEGDPSAEGVAASAESF